MGLYTFKFSPPLGKTPDIYISSHYNFNCAYFSKWHNFIKDGLGFQWGNI